MAITALTTRGNGASQSKTSGTTLNFQPWTTINGRSPADAGDILVLTIALDNTQTTDGQTSEVSSITDPRSNTWVKVAEFCNGQGGAGNGATVSVWKAKATTGYQVNDTITINFANTITAKAATVQSFTVGSGNDLELVSGSLQTLADDGADPGSMSISSLSSKEYLFIRGIARENTSANGTASTNFTRYDPVFGTSGGGSATNMSAWAEYRIVTATGETSDPTIASADTASVFFALEETTGGISGSLSKTLDALTSSGTSVIVLAGSTSATLAALTSSATGAVTLTGSLAATLDAATLSATGGATGIEGALSATLDDATASASGALLLQGSTSVTLDAVTSSASGALSLTGSLSQTLDALASSASGAVAITGNTSATLGDVTLVASGTGTFAAAQQAFRFYGNGADETSITAIAAQDTNLSVSIGSGAVNRHLRVRIAATAGAGAGTDDYQLQISTNGGAYANLPASGLVAYADLSLTDGQATTNQLTGGSGTFVAGKVSEDGLVDDLAIGSGQYTELLYALAVSANSAAHGDTVDFRVYRNGSALDTYSITPRISFAYDRAGSLSRTLDDVTLSATGSAAAISGSLSATLDAVVSSATAALLIAGNASATLDSLTASATGALALKGQSAALLDALEGSGQGAIRLAGTTTATLDDVAASASVAVALKGSASATLDTVTLVAQGSRPNSAALAVTLADLVAVATGARDAWVRGSPPPGTWVPGADGSGAWVQGSPPPGTWVPQSAAGGTWIPVVPPEGIWS